ncbi:MAG: hypothetical protein E6X17_14925 [Sporomusaceae bacterium]|nr:hypothetical protein [Sporomusaceae bacterium]
MSKETPFFSEISQVHKKNRQVIAVALVFFSLLLAWSVHKWFVAGIQQPIEIFFNLMFIVVIIERVQASYTVALTDKGVSVTKQSLFGSKVHQVDYTDIHGIYQYKTGLVHVIKFRRTYRLNSALDNRPVWVLAYSVPVKDGKLENRRIYFKASNELLDRLEEKLPGRVRLQEEQVALRILKK